MLYDSSWVYILTLLIRAVPNVVLHTFPSRDQAIAAVSTSRITTIQNFTRSYSVLFLFPFAVLSPTHLPAAHNSAHNSPVPEGCWARNTQILTLR